MTRRYRELIVQHSAPIEPVATSQPSVLQNLPGIEAVMFDIYGTLLISDSGDFDSVRTASQGERFVAALHDCGIRASVDGNAGVRRLSEEILAEQERGRQSGIAYPEVEILAIWQRVMQGLSEGGESDLSAESLGKLDYHALALAYELRANPVWPMPNASRCLNALTEQGIVLGLISNAQILTIDLWQTLLSNDGLASRIDDDLQIYSFQHRCAKPGPELYRIAADALARRGVKAQRVLYVGNDMLKDILPAQRIGFRTALFAGDARSLRLRVDDPRVAGVAADLVIKDLMDIVTCID